MIKIASLSVAAALLACGLSADHAQCAPRNRTFVSGKGTDDPATCCPVETPCQTFAFAITRARDGGEIDVLDSADYGPVTITQSISIVNDGAGIAGILALVGFTGVTINAGATDSVHLRGLTIEGLGVGTNGIQFNTGGNLANCVVRNFTLAGIAITPSTSSNFSVSNTIASDNPNEGIAINPKERRSSKACSAKSRRTIIIPPESSWMAHSRPGHRLMSPSSIARLPTTAASASRPSRCPARQPPPVMVRNVVASSNKDSGLAVQGNAILRVAHSVVTGNGTGVFTVGGGAIFSYGDNDIDGNANDNTGVLTSLAMH